MGEIQYLKASADNRTYLRLEYAVPVEFTIVRLQGDLPGLDWEKGSTSDVSKGGLCLKTNKLSESTIKFLDHQNIYLEVRMHLPLTAEPIKAVTELVWYKKDNNKFVIGLKYRSISSIDAGRILKFAKLFRWPTKLKKLLKPKQTN